VNLDTESGHILLFELSSQVALDEGGLGRKKNCRLERCPSSGSGVVRQEHLAAHRLDKVEWMQKMHRKLETHLASAAVADEDEFEGGDFLGGHDVASNVRMCFWVRDVNKRGGVWRMAP